MLWSHFDGDSLKSRGAGAMAQQRQAYHDELTDSLVDQMKLLAPLRLPPGEVRDALSPSPEGEGRARAQSVVMVAAEAEARPRAMSIAMLAPPLPLHDCTLDRYKPRPLIGFGHRLATAPRHYHVSAATDEALNVVSSDAMATLVAERRASVAARGRRSDLVAYNYLDRSGGGFKGTASNDSHSSSNDETPLPGEERLKTPGQADSDAPHSAGRPGSGPERERGGGDADAEAAFSRPPLRCHSPPLRCYSRRRTWAALRQAGTMRRGGTQGGGSGRVFSTRRRHQRCDEAETPTRSPPRSRTPGCQRPRPC